MQIGNLPSSLQDVGPGSYSMLLLKPADTKSWGMSTTGAKDWSYYAPNEIAMRMSGEIIFPHFSIMASSRYFSKKANAWVNSPTKLKVSTVHLSPKAGPTKRDNPHLWWDGASDDRLDSFYVFSEDRAYRNQVRTKAEHDNNVRFFVDFLNKLRIASSDAKQSKLPKATTSVIADPYADESWWDNQ